MMLSAVGSKRASREVAWFGITALSFVVLEIFALRAWATLTRPFWLDETSTYLLATKQSLGASMHSLAAGTDSNPPALFFIYRAVATVAGDLTPTTARVVALLCVVAALTTVYMLLRDQFAPWPAAIGALGVWAQQVVMHAAFDARFYGPLLFASGCFMLALVRTVRAPATRLSIVALALASVFLCTIHYFGILAWTIAIATIVASRADTWSVVVRRLVPSAAGPLALAACYPLYVGQRASLTLPTWIPQPTAMDGMRLLAVFFLTMPIAVALVCWALMRVREWHAADTPRYAGPTFSLGPRLLLAQVVLPFILMAFSLLVQPATELRYWIVGALAPAPVIALVMSRADVVVRWVGTVGVIAASVKTLWGEANRADAFVQRVREDVMMASRLVASGTMVVTRHRDTLYPVLHARPELRDYLAVLDSAPFDSTNAFFVVERDLERVHRDIYGFPTILTPADLDSVPAFYLIEQRRGEVPTNTEFPNRTITRVADRAYSLVRQDRRFQIQSQYRSASPP